MPKLSVWMIRAALIHMGVGFLFGALILCHKGIPIYSWIWKLLELHADLMIFGWTMQLVMGVMFYAMPRFSARENRYGQTYLGWWSFYLLNGGVILSALAHWFHWRSYVLSGYLLILLAVLIYAIMIWQRIKPIGVIT
ncbi:MAG: hypothetical protein D6711_11860 [Chloroflexi bacterium]|nr:MAG: hypothetical protein D6711_11860 [Chloroflexota bacterium]